MKRLLAVVALLLLVVSPSFALSDADYLKFKKNANFARADKKLTQVWNSLKKSMQPKHFAELQQNQRYWIKTGRDEVARNYIKEGYSRVEAYTMATNDRARDLPGLAEDIRNSYSTKTSAKKTTTPARRTVKKRDPEPKSYEVPDEEMESQPLTDDDDYGEIEEDRFKGSTGPEGNYVRHTAGSRGGFMTVTIIDKEQMQVEITISFSDPEEVTWSATGWIDDNVMEVADTDFSTCQSTFTFSDGRVVVETTDTDDWDEVLAESLRLDGTYTKVK